MSAVSRVLEAFLGRLLMSRAVMSMKPPAKNLVWRVRGLLLARTVPPRAPRSLLFVCKGNICRSPFAAGVARNILAALGRNDVLCESAGLRAQSSVVPPEAVDAARLFGVSLDDHHPTMVTDDLLERSDMIIVMEPGQLRELVQRHEGLRNRLFILPVLDPGVELGSGYLRYHVPDPYGKAPEQFAACYRQIAGCLTRFLSSTFPSHASGAPRP